MSDGFRNNESGVAGVVSSLKSISSNYRTCIQDIATLVKSIASSSSWIDASVKTSFITTCSTYIISYSALADAMDLYIEYISQASSRASDIESHYAG